MVDRQFSEPHGVALIDRDGTGVRFETEVETPVVVGVVRFTNSYRRAD